MKNIIKMVSSVLFISMICISCEKDIEEEIVVASTEQDDDAIYNWDKNLSENDKRIMEEVNDWSEKESNGVNQSTQKSETTHHLIHNYEKKLVATIYRYRNHNDPAPRQIWAPQYWAQFNYIVQKDEIQSIALRPNTKLVIYDTWGRHAMTVDNRNRGAFYDGNFDYDLGVANIRVRVAKGYKLAFFTNEDKMQRIAGLAYQHSNFHGQYIPIWMGGGIMKQKIKGNISSLNDQFSSFKSVKYSKAGQVIFSEDYNNGKHREIAFAGAFSIPQFRYHDRASSIHVLWK
ncbi:hypothetical protein [Aquimarina sp. 2201CG14-23]|uniref:hypothetical protein n=1 Tax=Aquimarina mycalae TaxID=3040073 RepID=UPI002477D771|nr:hypothetical protein [Aquimarina sp. 2201CG14-23]MDH7447065.1 hypothetical protein [Aquimarina sp. 2201CG14-23]